jgi:hypothetical protein
LVRVTDSRIRICTKMSRIHNTDMKVVPRKNTVPVDQVAVEGARHRPDGVLQKPQPPVQILRVGAERAHDHVRVAVHVLGEAVVGDVGAQLERSLEVGGLEGVVHHEEEVLVLLHYVGNGLDVHHLQYIWSSNSADES